MMVGGALFPEDVSDATILETYPTLDDLLDDLQGLSPEEKQEFVDFYESIDRERVLAELDARAAASSPAPVAPAPAPTPAPAAPPSSVSVPPSAAEEVADEPAVQPLRLSGEGEEQLASSSQVAPSSGAAGGAG